MAKDDEYCMAYRDKTGYHAKNAGDSPKEVLRNAMASLQMKMLEQLAGVPLRAPDVP